MKWYLAPIRKKKTDNIKFEEKVDQLEFFYTVGKNIIW